MALFGGLLVEAVIAPLRGDKQREQGFTNDAVPVAGRDRILVFGAQLHRRGFPPIKLSGLIFVFYSPRLDSYFFKRNYF